MRRGPCTVISGLLLILLAGCGGSSHKTASAVSSTTAASPPPPPSLPPGVVPPNAPSVRALAGRGLKAGDITGFAPQGEAAATNAKAWVAVEGYPASERTSEVRRLERLGFVSATSAHLARSAGSGSEALSIVIRFRSPRSALANVEQEVKTNDAHGAKPFAVAGIPGAKGFGGVFGSGSGYNVAFAVGPYYYLAGVGYPTGTPGAPTKEQLIAAARRLYGRAHR
jgi:hypothetical protein